MKSLRSKIHTGFAILIILLIAIGFIGYHGVNQLNQSSTAMRQVSEVDAIVGAIDRNVTDLQLRVSRYMATGHESLRTDVVRLNNDLISTINDQATNQAAPEMRDLFQRMSERLPEYREHFRSVIEERQLRSNLVQEQLPAQARVIQKELVRLGDSSNASGEDKSLASAALRCKNHFLEAERLLLRYYVAADTTLVDEALEQINQAIKALEPAAPDAKSNAVVAALTGELQKYKKIGIRAVQATRSYLYLVNVVMAGEASEVTYFSERLRSLSESKLALISQNMAATTSSVRRMTVIGIFIAVSLGVLIASRLGSLILKPVTTLTDTFRKLVTGDTVVSIPETNRSDEIGEMALAAEVFRQRNLEQQQLLEKSESLANQLAIKAEELEATNSELDSFAYVASHDLKSPLRGIQQLAAWIEEDSGHLLPHESIKHFQAMQSRVHRMENLLEDLLNFSRVGRTEIQLEQVDLNELLQGILEITDNPSNAKINVPEPLPTLETARIPIEQVFLNLIGNAIKHNDKEKDGRIDVLWEQQEDHYLFHIRDNGPGIEPRHHERVFQMYQRVGDGSVDGSGMGLAIVKKQIERHQGSIRLDSNPGEGVTFTVTWPIALASIQEVQ